MGRRSGARGYDSGQKIFMALNGQTLVDEKTRNNTPHWGGWDVTALLTPGSNRLALLSPAGFIGYRVYLSPDEPKQYPFLGFSAATLAMGQFLRMD